MQEIQHVGQHLKQMEHMDCLYLQTTAVSD
jgi:hypothetical protein